MSIVDFPAASAPACGPGGKPLAGLAGRLELSVQPCGGYSIVSVWGELRAETTDQLNDLLKGLVRAGTNRVLLDLSRLYDLDAEAITELSHWRNVLVSSGGALLLAAPRPWVRRLLEHMCLRGTFTVYPTVLEALAEIAPSQLPDVR